ncbi:MAG: 3'-5' exonuclease [Myxococcota bacterium]
MAERKLTLTRPLVVFDLETTGLDVNSDRIVEMSCVKIAVDGTRDLHTRRMNPTIPISPSATEVHGITDADVANEPTFSQLARSLFEYFAGCDLSGFNIEHFDLPLLVREFARIDIEFPVKPVSIIDCYKIFFRKEPRDLVAAYRFYCDRELVNAHSAEADTLATADVLMAQVRRYNDLPTEIEALHEFCHPMQPDWIDPDGKIRWRDGEAVLGFGKNNGMALRKLAAENPDYLRWMSTANFSADVVRIVRAAMRGELPEAPEVSDSK